jgi:chromosome segregation ATPase
MTNEATLALIATIGTSLGLIGVLVQQMIKLVQTLISEQQQTRAVIEQDKKDAEATRAVIERNTQAFDATAQALRESRASADAGFSALTGEVGQVRDDLEAISTGLQGLRGSLDRFSTAHTQREKREAQLMQQIGGLMAQLKVLEKHAVTYFNERGDTTDGH